MDPISVHRTLPALELEHSPLVFFMGQVRFNPILAMADHLGEIQERLRKLGYPRFERIEPYNVILAASGAATVEKVALWVFSAADRKSEIVLSNEFVTYETTEYRRYEDTLPKVLEAVHAVHDVVGIDLLQRAGLRYLDAVTPNWSTGERFETYLQPGMIGLHGDVIGAEVIHHSSLFVGRTSVQGTLVVRFTTSQAPNVLPPDLANSTLAFGSLSVRDGERIGILDFDHYVESSEPFSMSRAQTLLSDLHDAIVRGFNACTTDTARELWGKHEVQ